MPKHSRTRYALLGALTFGEKSGYDLKKEFEHRMSPFWAESLGQIYPTLHRLRDEKLVTARTESGGAGGGRPRTLYRLTAAGRRELRAWLGESPELDTVRNELLLKLFFGPELGIEASIRHLQEFERAQLQRCRSLTAMADEIEAQAVTQEQRLFWRLTLLSGQEVAEARLRWCRKALRTLREHAEAAAAPRSSSKGRVRR